MHSAVWAAELCAGLPRQMAQMMCVTDEQCGTGLGCGCCGWFSRCSRSCGSVGRNSNFPVLSKSTLKGRPEIYACCSHGPSVLCFVEIFDLSCCSEFFEFLCRLLKQPLAWVPHAHMHSQGCAVESLRLSPLSRGHAWMQPKGCNARCMPMYGFVSQTLTEYPSDRIIANWGQLSMIGFNG